MAPVQPDLFDRTPSPRFDGPTVTRDDEIRLSPQLDRVFRVMRRRSGWITVPEIALEIEKSYGVYCAQTAIAARVRDLRKPRNGGHLVESRRRGGKGGLWEFKLTVRGGS